MDQFSFTVAIFLEFYTNRGHPRGPTDAHPVKANAALNLDFQGGRIAENIVRVNDDVIKGVTSIVDEVQSIFTDPDRLARMHPKRLQRLLIATGVV
jgi:hypothetical protein